MRRKVGSTLDKISLKLVQLRFQKQFQSMIKPYNFNII